MTYKALIAAAAFISLPSAAVADQHCYITYHEFEEKVPHLDVDQCPGAKATDDNSFCRLVVSGAEIAVYEFEYGDEENCLTNVTRYDGGDFIKRFGARYTSE